LATGADAAFRAWPGFMAGVTTADLFFTGLPVKLFRIKASWQAAVIIAASVILGVW